MGTMIFRLSGNEVLQIRQKLGMTQREMAYRLGVSENTYRRWERQGATPVASRALEAMVE